MMMATIGLPLSKSISNRMLIINALTPGTSALSEIAECDDTDLLSKALVQAAGPTGEITVNTEPQAPPPASSPHICAPVRASVPQSTEASACAGVRWEY